MTTIATLGPKGSHAWQATRLYMPDAETKLFRRITDVIQAFNDKDAEFAVIPVYNTRAGEIKEYFRVMEKLTKGYWINNIILPIHLSLGSLEVRHKLSLLIGRGPVLKQCEEYIMSHFPDISLMAVPDIEQSMLEIKEKGLADHGVIESEEILKAGGFTIRERELASHNRTRFAVLGKKPVSPTGYDATAMITAPLKDRVGLLFDTLGELSKRGINILDMRSETDIKTQKLQFYLETEGHFQDEALKKALERIENTIIQETDSIKVLGSYPRIDMRTKHIETFGFIGTGEMSKWFAEKLANEGYRNVLTGRSTKLRPEEMIKQVDVVIICVPISTTVAAIEKYGPLLHDGQALILLAGEAENTLKTALKYTGEGVEAMLVHNLWGPQAANMKNKIASVVRTARSGALCSEFEAFLYKHGAEIYHDTPIQHDLLMGVGQKLPTTISVALALTLSQHAIRPDDIGSHATLTSLYAILGMSRVHSQNARTYAEIMSSRGEGGKLVRDFVKNLTAILELSDAGNIEELCAIIEKNKTYLSEDFLKARMAQALAVDQTLTNSQKIGT